MSFTIDTTSPERAWSPFMDWLTYRWLRIRWPQRLTTETPCPRCGVGIRNWSGSGHTPKVRLHPCGHLAVHDPFTGRLHPYPQIHDLGAA